MKMKKITILLICGLILVFDACKKEDKTPPDDDNPLPEYPLVKFAINEDGDTTKFVYDTLFRADTIIGIEFSNGSNSGPNFSTFGSPSNILEYTYNSNTVFVNGTASYNLNSKGLVASPVTQGSISIAYSYNADSTLSSRTTQGIVVNYTYANGNLTGYTSTFPNGTGGTVSRTGTYTYTSHPNTFGNKNIGQFFLGKSSTNALSNWNETSLNNSTGEVIEYNVDYTYTLDSEGRIATMQKNDGTSTKTYKFFYY